ncbi:sensor histidine kinase [Paraglaciecola sp. L3A3]|uniref:sensor histidine kinase n=1 Tax=Paraglaciecola sp. L3A3 TaxID=2686358 RepID=UPI00131DF6B4|nr:ATP-binding protein [Paraglaciecola sp. L3A3]
MIISKRYLMLIVIFVYWLLMNAATLHMPIQFFDNIAVPSIVEAEYTVSSAITLDELSGVSWQQVSLPDDWLSRKSDDSDIWYKLRFNVSQSSLKNFSWAAYLSSVTHTAAVFVNGIWVGQSGRFTPNVSRYHNQPLMFEFANNILVPGDNELLIHVRSAYKNYGLLSGVYVAPSYILKPAYNLKYLVRVGFVQWFTAIMLFVAVVLLVFYCARPQDTLYGIFAFEIIFWSLHNLNLLVNNIPVSVRLWEAFTMSTLVWAVALMIFFNHRYIGVENKKVERLTLFVSLLGFVMFFLPNVEMIFLVGYTFSDICLFALGTYTLVFLLTQYWRNPNVDIALMLFVGTPIMVFGLHDILLVNNFIPRTDGLIMQYSAFPSLLLFSWFLIKRFVNSLNAAEDLTINLERKVKIKENELIVQFQQVKVLEQKHLLSEERERIMRDMHDGIGGQLVSVVATLSGSKNKELIQVREKIKQSLTDLRMVIDSLDPEFNNLATLLATLRASLQENLHNASIKLNWDMNTIPEVKSTTPSKNIHILRIVQECITNAIKHAKCSELTLRVFSKRLVDNNYLIIIEIEDNGCGFIVNELEKNGARGLKNLKYRAQEINSSLMFESTSKGTKIRLEIR